MGAISGSGPAAGGLARGRRDRRRRPVADGAGGPGDDAGRARLDRALPERRHQHRGAGRGDGRHAGHQLHAHHPRRLPRPLPARGDVPGRRVQGRPLRRKRRGHTGRRRRDAARVPARRRACWPRGHRRPGHRLLLGQADRHRDADRGGGRRPAGASWSPRTTTPRAGSARRSPDALLAAGQQNLHLTHLAVREMPGSGTGAELLAWAGIDADHIAAAARKLAGGR